MPAESAHRSTSSPSTTRIGFAASPEGALDPTSVMCPPGNSFTRNVLPLAREVGSRTRSFKAGESSIIGANRILDHPSASSMFGSTTRMGAGSWCMKYPATFRMHSVFPTCAEDITTTSSTRGSEKASMMPCRYGARAVRHCPGSALASRESTRNRSAHSDTVSRGGGAKRRRRSSSRICATRTVAVSWVAITRPRLTTPTTPTPSRAQARRVHPPTSELPPFAAPRAPEWPAAWPGSCRTPAPPCPAPPRPR